MLKDRQDWIRPKELNKWFRMLIKCRNKLEIIIRIRRRLRSSNRRFSKGRRLIKIFWMLCHLIFRLRSWSRRGGRIRDSSSSRMRGREILIMLLSWHLLHLSSETRSFSLQKKLSWVPFPLKSNKKPKAFANAYKIAEEGKCKSFSTKNDNKEIDFKNRCESKARLRSLRRIKKILWTKSTLQMIQW